MTTIPFATHHQIRNAVAALMVGVHNALRARGITERIKDHASKLVHLPYEGGPTIWYIKGTKADLAFSRRTGYIVLDHVRRWRSDPISNYAEAIKARQTALKEIEEYEDAQREEAGAVPVAGEAPQAQEP